MDTRLTRTTENHRSPRWLSSFVCSLASAQSKVPAVAAEMLLIASFAFFAAPAPTEAAPSADFQCDQISPALTELGDRYYDLNDSPNAATHNLNSEGQTLLGSLQNFKPTHGSGTRTVCFGPRAEHADFHLDSVNMYYRLNGTWVISAHEERRKTLSIRRIELPTDHLWQFTGSNLEARHLERRHSQFANNKKSSLLAEIRSTVADLGYAISISQTLYVNGFAAEHVNWQLTR